MATVSLPANEVERACDRKRASVIAAREHAEKKWLKEYMITPIVTGYLWWRRELFPTPEEAQCAFEYDSYRGELISPEYGKLWSEQGKLDRFLSRRLSRIDTLRISASAAGMHQTGNLHERVVTLTAEEIEFLEI